MVERIKTLSSREQKAQRLKEQVLKTEQSLNALIYLYEKRYLSTTTVSK